MEPITIDKKIYSDLLGTDVFRDQLIYALTGKPKCSTTVLSDPFTLDAIWPLLRNTGMFTFIQRFSKKMKDINSKTAEQACYNFTRV